MRVLVHMAASELQRWRDRLHEAGVEPVTTLSSRPAVILAVLGGEGEEAARRDAASSGTPLVWAVDTDELSRSDPRLGQAAFVVATAPAAEVGMRLRRAAAIAALHGFELPGCRVELDRAQLRLSSGEVRPLTLTEVGLLRTLCGAEGRALSRQELLRQVWGYRGNTRTRAVDIAMRRLRLKLEPAPASPRWLLTVKGVGYRLACDELVLQADAAPLPVASGRAAPLSTTPLMGRDSELAFLERTLAPEGASLAVIGAPGVGRRRLVHEWLQQQEQAAHTVDVSPDEDPAEALRRSLRAPSLEKALLGLESRLLWLQTHGPCTNDWARLADALKSAGLRWVVTGDTAPPGVDRALAVTPLGPDQALAVAESVRSEDAPLEPPLDPAEPAVRGLLARAGGLPLVLELIGAELVGRTPAELLRDWGHSTVAADPLQDKLLHTWTSLAPPEQRALVVLAHLDGGTTPHGIGHLLSHAGVPSALVLLQRRALVQRMRSPRGTRLSVPTPVADGVRRIAEPAQRDAATAALRSWCVWLGSDACAAALRTPGAAGLLEELDARASDIASERAVETASVEDRLALRWAAHRAAVYAGRGSAHRVQPLPAEASTGQHAAWAYLDAQDALQRGERVAPESLRPALDASLAAGSEALTHMLRSTLAYALLGSGKTPEAAAVVDDMLAARTTLSPQLALGAVALALTPGLPTAGSASLRAALLDGLRERRAAGDALSGARHAAYAAASVWREGRVAEALEMLESATEAARELADPVSEARHLGNVATARLVLGDIAGARAAQDRALGLMERLGMQQGLCVDLGLHAELLHIVGDGRASRTRLREAAAATRTELLPRYRGLAWRSVARVAISTGDWARATEACARGLEATGDADAALVLELRALDGLVQHWTDAGTAVDIRTTEWENIPDANARLRIAGILAALEGSTSPWAARLEQTARHLPEADRRDVRLYRSLCAGEHGDGPPLLC